MYPIRSIIKNVSFTIWTRYLDEFGCKSDGTQIASLIVRGWHLHPCHQHLVAPATLIRGGPCVLEVHNQRLLALIGKNIKLYPVIGGGGDNIWIMNTDGTWSQTNQTTGKIFRLVSNNAVMVRWCGIIFFGKKAFTSTRSTWSGEYRMYTNLVERAYSIHQKKITTRCWRNPGHPQPCKFVFYSWGCFYPGW